MYTYLFYIVGMVIKKIIDLEKIYIKSERKADNTTKLKNYTISLVECIYKDPKTIKIKIFNALFFINLL